MEDITIKEDKSFDEAAEKNEATEKPEEKTNKPNKSNKSEEPKKESKGKNIAITILSIAVLALSATLAVLLINSKKDNQDNKQNETSKTEEKKEEQPTDEPAADPNAETSASSDVQTQLAKKIRLLHGNSITEDANENYLKMNSMLIKTLWNSLYHNTMSDKNKVELILGFLNRSELQTEEEKKYAENIIARHNSPLTDDRASMMASFKKASYSDFENEYEKLFGSKPAALETTYSPVTCTSVEYSEELKEFFFTPFGGCGGVGHPFYHVYISKYTKKGNEAYVDAYLGVQLQGIQQGDKKAMLGFEKYMSSNTEEVIKNFSTDEEAQSFRINEENKSDYDHYRFVFKLDNSGTNYVFDHVEKV